jgi:hypothetical protein
MRESMRACISVSCSGSGIVTTAGTTILTRSHHAFMVDRAATARPASCAERPPLPGAYDELDRSDRLIILLAKLDFKSDHKRYTIICDFRCFLASSAWIVSCSDACLAETRRPNDTESDTESAATNDKDRLVAVLMLALDRGSSGKSTRQSSIIAWNASAWILINLHGVLHMMEAVRLPPA